MKLLLVAACACACALSCAYAAEDKAAEVLRSDFGASPGGEYHYQYETSNGIHAEAKASYKTVDKDKKTLEVHGTNQYKSPDGQAYQLTYVANENGYQPVGSHLPTTPPPMPIPDYILKAIEYIKAHPYDEKKVKN